MTIAQKRREIIFPRQHIKKSRPHPFFQQTHKIRGPEDGAELFEGWRLFVGFEQMNPSRSELPHALRDCKVLGNKLLEVSFEFGWFFWWGRSVGGFFLPVFLVWGWLKTKKTLQKILDWWTCEQILYLAMYFFHTFHHQCGGDDQESYATFIHPPVIKCTYQVWKNVSLLRIPCGTLG